MPGSRQPSDAAARPSSAAPTAIGRGLAPAREARAIGRGEVIHVVGVAGAGASAAALLASAAGALVSGCDPGAPSPYTEALAAHGIAVADAHAAAHIMAGRGAQPSRLAVTKALTSVQPDHPELEAARRAGIVVEPWQQVVADAAVNHGGRLVAVAGTHGKSTSAGWLVHLLVACGRDPGAFVGALLPASAHRRPTRHRPLGAGRRLRRGGGRVRGQLRPVSALGRHRAQRGMGPSRRLRRPRGGRGCLRALAPCAWRGDPQGRHQRRRCRWRGAGRPAHRLGRPRGAGGRGGRARRDRWLPQPRQTTGHLGSARRGRRGCSRPNCGCPAQHNAANAACVAAAAALLGVGAADIASGLASFEGVGRRLEVKGEAAGVLVIDDYGHHPTAIRATIDAVRERYPGRPLWVAHEPLTYHRAAAMLDELASGPRDRGPCRHRRHLGRA